MKTALTILILALSISVFGQKNEFVNYIAYQMAEKTTGEITHTWLSEDGSQNTVIQIPIYHDFEIVQLALQVFLHQNKDVILENNWRPLTGHPTSWWVVLNIAELQIVLMYDFRENTLFVAPK